MNPTPSRETPAAGADELRDALEQQPDGPNVAPSLDEVQAARGEVPLEGRHAEGGDADPEATADADAAGRARGER